MPPREKTRYCDPLHSELRHHRRPLSLSRSFSHLVLEEPREPDEEDLEDARLEEGDLVVVVQTLEAGDELGEGAHLPHVVHEALAELLQERVLRPALHRTRLK